MKIFNLKILPTADVADELSDIYPFRYRRSEIQQQEEANGYPIKCHVVTGRFVDFFFSDDTHWINRPSRMSTEEDNSVKDWKGKELEGSET